MKIKEKGTTTVLHEIFQEYKEAAVRLVDLPQLDTSILHLGTFDKHFAITKFLSVFENHQ